MKFGGLLLLQNKFLHHKQEMQDTSPYSRNANEIVQRALEKCEMDKLLLGFDEYRYLDKTSYTTGTDILSLLRSYYRNNKHSQGELRDQLTEGIFRIIDLYDSIPAIASCILFETSRIYDKRHFLGLPLESITLRFRKTIKKFQDRLEENDPSNPEENLSYDDLQFTYMDLHRLSRIVVGLGGMAFCEGTEHDPIQPIY